MIFPYFSSKIYVPINKNRDNNTKTLVQAKILKDRWVREYFVWTLWPPTVTRITPLLWTLSKMLMTNRSSTWRLMNKRGHLIKYSWKPKQKKCNKYLSINLKEYFWLSILLKSSNIKKSMVHAESLFKLYNFQIN